MDYAEANRGVWNAWTVAHTGSEHHRDLETFRAGGLSLRPIERAELGDIAGKSLLHLLCNMGSDTLSWARLGTHVTGVDISYAAIERARALAQEAGLPARFIRADLYALPEALDERFDIVFMSYGALCWLADLDRWAALVARYLKPGGVLYLVEMHPFAGVFDPMMADASGMRVRREIPYGQPEPIAEDVAATTADPAHATVYSWYHGLGAVVTALLSAGLRLEFLHEFPYAHYLQFPTLVQRDDGYWHWPDPRHTWPLLFSLRAMKAD
jgi:SAM-dependent methyltransferase